MPQLSRKLFWKEPLWNHLLFALEIETADRASTERLSSKHHSNMPRMGKAHMCYKIGLDGYSAIMQQTEIWWCSICPTCGIGGRLLNIRESTSLYCTLKFTIRINMKAGTTSSSFFRKYSTDRKWTMNLDGCQSPTQYKKQFLEHYIGTYQCNNISPHLLIFTSWSYGQWTCAGLKKSNLCACNIKGSFGGSYLNPF